MTIPPDQWHQNYVPTLEDWQAAFAAGVSSSDLTVGLLSNYTAAVAAATTAATTVANAAVATEVSARVAADALKYNRTGGPLTGPVSQAQSGEVFAQNGAIINRFGDRLFVGPACTYDGAYPSVTQDWLSTFYASATGGSEPNVASGAQLFVLSSIGQAGGLFGSRTSDNSGTGSDNTYPVAAFALNDYNGTIGRQAWGYYGEARRLSGASGLTFAMELDVSNQGNVVTGNPYQQLPGATGVIQVASGCGVQLPGNANTSFGIQIVNNQTAFQTGIIFGSTAIAGTDGITGAGVAIAFAKGHALTWYNSAGSQTAGIQGAVATAGLATRLLFDDTGFNVTNTANAAMVRVPAIASAVNGVKMFGSVTGSAPAVVAFGSDTNVDLILAGQGTGMLNLGASTSPAATGGAASALPGAPAGYATFKVSGTTVKFPYYAV